MALTKEEVLHIAKLARLELNPDEVAKFQTQLSEILEYVNKLQKLNTEGNEPINQITGLKNVMRDDQIDQCNEDAREEMLKQAPKKKDNLIETLRVFD